MEEVAFALNVSDGWPPVGVEHVWCDRAAPVYQLMTAPFFIKGLARGDKFSAVPDPVNGCILEFTTVEASGHSLVWILEQETLDLESYKGELAHLGLGIEIFPQLKYYAIDVPASVDCYAVNTIMDRLQELGFAIAFPVWRH